MAANLTAETNLTFAVTPASGPKAWWVNTYYQGTMAVLWHEGMPRAQGLAALAAIENTAAMSRMAGYFAELDVQLVIEVRLWQGLQHAFDVAKSDLH